MKAESYPCPLPGGAAASELALVFDRSRDKRLLIAPALFDEQFPRPAQIAPDEWAARLQLAACYRIFDLLG